MFETCFDFDTNMLNSFKCPFLKKVKNGVVGGFKNKVIHKIFN